MRKILFLLYLSVFTIVSNLSFAKIDSTLPSYEATYQDWKVFTIEQNGQNVCYALSSPKDMSGNYKDDREPYIMVAIFGKIRQEISITAGYFYRPNSIVSVSIDGIQERFVAENDTLAWPEKTGVDKKIIKEMLNSNKLLVFSESLDNKYSVDTYSLKGFQKAYNKIKELCSK